METYPHPAQILVIEDNPGDIRMLRYALDQHERPYELQVLSDGEQALEFVQRQRPGSSPERPCVIVLDLHLPKHRGMEVLRAIHEVPAISHVGVVVLTSFGDPLEAQQALDLGARIYRTKPLDLDEWVAIAGEILAVCRGLWPAHV
jgi:two-component system response regulator